MSLGIGSVCVKTAGRKAGEKVIILELDNDKHFATIIGPGVKKKRCNMKHLLPIGKKIEVGKNVSQKELEKLLKE